MPGNAAAKIVALLGVSGSGKSIVTRRLVERHGFTRIRFIDPVRDMLKAGFGLTDEFLDSYQRNQAQARFGGRTLDNMLSSLSQWSREHVHADACANEWRRRVDAAGSDWIVADDVMRPNEAAAVRAAGGLVVRVTRPNFTPRDHVKAQRLAVIPADMELVNHGPDELAGLTDRFIQGLHLHLTKGALA